MSPACPLPSSSNALADELSCATSSLSPTVHPPLARIATFSSSFFAWLSFLLSFFSWYAMPPLLAATIKRDLALTDDEVANSNIVAGVTSLIVRLIAGPLCDRIGPVSIVLFHPVNWPKRADDDCILRSARSATSSSARSFSRPSPAALPVQPATQPVSTSFASSWASLELHSCHVRL